MKYSAVRFGGGLDGRRAHIGDVGLPKTLMAHRPENTRSSLRRLRRVLGFTTALLDQKRKMILREKA
jgi:hypothetical protein